jgi:hypothetical protein
MTTRALIVAACLTLGGCTTLTDFGVSVRKESLKNDQGHVIGYKELLRNPQTGEVIAQVSMYTPVLDSNGALMGYEEHAKDGAVIRDVNGRAIGSRFGDLRSRGTNSKSKGVMVVFRPADAPVVAVTQPKIWELIASLSASDLRRIQ